MLEYIGRRYVSQIDQKRVAIFSRLRRCHGAFVVTTLLRTSTGDCKYLLHQSFPFFIVG